MTSEERLKALLEAIRRGDAGGVESRLREEPALIHARDEGGNTALHHAIGSPAAAAAAEDCLRRLLKCGADPGAVNDDGWTPLRQAVWFGYRRAADLLRQWKAPMYGPRPTFSPPAAVVGVVEQILSRAWSGPVTLGSCYSLREDRVLRFEIAAAPQQADGPRPASVVVKQARRSEESPYNPEAADGWNGAWSLFEDWTATRLFTSLANSDNYALCCYGGDRDAGVIVIEDLGDEGALVDRLMDDDPRRAEEGLRLLAECLGKLHAATMGHHDRYWAYRDALGPRVQRRRWPPLSQYHEELFKGFAVLGIKPAAGFDAELEQVAVAVESPGPFLAYVHGDACPDNCRIVQGKLRLVDFETGGFQHALLDAAAFRLAFPSCWCVNRLPPSMAPLMESTYRAELVKGCPAAADDRRFYQELSSCCAYWLITSEIWLLGNALRRTDSGAPPPGGSASCFGWTPSPMLRRSLATCPHWAPRRVAARRACARSGLRTPVRCRSTRRSETANRDRAARPLKLVQLAVLRREVP
jgi:hypothetical protein